MSQTAIQTQPARIAGFFNKGVVDADRMTLASFVQQALNDAIPMFEADQYLVRKLAAAEAAGDPGRAYAAVDAYLARAVEFQLKNREPNERVRRASITVLSSANLETRRARCVIKIRAWDHEVRHTLDLKLPTGA